MTVEESSKWLSNIYDALRETVFTEFRFFNDALEEPSIYTITLEVEDKCVKDTLIDIDMNGLSGKLQWRSVD